MKQAKISRRDQHDDKMAEEQATGRTDDSTRQFSAPNIWPVAASYHHIKDWCYEWHVDRYDLCKESAEMVDVTAKNQLKTQKSIMKISLAYFMLFFDENVAELPAGVLSGRSHLAQEWVATLNRQILNAWNKVEDFALSHPVSEKVAGPPVHVTTFKNWMQKIDHHDWPQGPADGSTSKFGIRSRDKLVETAEGAAAAAAAKAEKKAKKRRLDE